MASQVRGSLVCKECQTEMAVTTSGMKMCPACGSKLQDALVVYGHTVEICDRPQLVYRNIVIGREMLVLLVPERCIG